MTTTYFSLKPYSSFRMQPCCLSHPLTTWCFTAFSGLSPWVNRLLNNSLAPGIIGGIYHLLQGPCATTRQQREMERTSSWVRGWRQTRLRSPATSYAALSRKCGFLESLRRGQRSENRISGSCYCAQMLQREAAQLQSWGAPNVLWPPAQT